jgi:hypothetical protein
MKSEKTCVFFRILATAAAMQFGIFASSAQTDQFLYTGSETTITLNPGTYDITAYGAQGGGGSDGVLGGLGAEMDSQFNFTGVTTLTILVGGAGGSPNPTVYGGGGGGGSFVVNGSTPLVVAGGGGGGYGSPTGFVWPIAGGVGNIGNEGGTGGGFYGGTGGSGGNTDLGNVGGPGGGGFYSSGGGNYGSPGGSSFLSGGAGVSGMQGAGGGYGGGGGGTAEGAGGGGGYSGGGGSDFSGAGGGGSYVAPSVIKVLAEVSGVPSPNDSPNGEIMITESPEPTTLALAGLSGLFLMLFRRRRSWVNP